MSEFYKLRRASITDITGLVAFVIGWLGSGVIGWPYIKGGFDAGNPTAGVFRFIIVVFAGGIGCGLVGMMFGWIGGLIWQRQHQTRRSRAEHVETDSGGATVASQTAGRARSEPRAALPALRFSNDVDADAYIALVTRAGITPPERARTAAALERSINIGAWEGNTLVGAARVLSDGYFFAALADIYVDPAIQRRGLGRDLMNRAYERTPRGALFLGSPLSIGAFFDHIGCERGPTGFTMRRAARASE